MRTLLLATLAFPLVAAAPQGLSLQVPADRDPFPARPPATTGRAPVFQPAPRPNRDLDGPAGPRADGAPSVGPGFFTRSDTYRGEGYAPGSSAASEQDKRVKPGAGFSLRVPFAPE